MGQAMPLEASSWDAAYWLRYRSSKFCTQFDSFFIMINMYLIVQSLTRLYFPEYFLFFLVAADS